MKNKIASFILAAAFALLGSSVAKAFQPVVTVPLYSGISQNMTLKITSTPASPWNTSVLSLNSTVFDASAYTQGRLVVSVGNIQPNATTSLFGRFLPLTASPFQNNTASAYLPLGDSGDIGVSFDGTAGKVWYSPWIDLDAAAIGDDALTVIAVDTANAGKQPAFGSIAIQFR
jgi:hypothetical protein